MGVPVLSKTAQENARRCWNSTLPLCSSKLILRKGKYGEFYGCSNYPDCKFMLPKPIIYEVLEDGYAEYRIYKGELSGRVFLLKFEEDKIKIEVSKWFGHT